VFHAETAEGRRGAEGATEQVVKKVRSFTEQYLVPLLVRDRKS
jgi:hypothetical protein